VNYAVLHLLITRVNWRFLEPRSSSSCFEQDMLSDHLHMVDLTESPQAQKLSHTHSLSLSLSGGRQVLFELDERCTQYISYRCTASLAHAGGQPRPRYGIELLSCGAISVASRSEATAPVIQRYRSCAHWTARRRPQDLLSSRRRLEAHLF
jgi:hypothetical protein